MSDSNVEVIRRLNAAFNAGDNVTYAALVAPDAEFVDHLPLPDVASEGQGPDEMVKVLEQWREGFVGFRADVQEYIDLGDYVVCSTQWHFTARDSAIQTDWPGAEAHQIRDGKLIWSAVGFRDVQEAMKAVEERRAG